MRGLAWSPVDDTLYTSGWGQQIFSHAFDCGGQSDLNVEASKSQATSVCMEIFNGEVNGNETCLDEENADAMELDGAQEIKTVVSCNVDIDSPTETAPS